VRQNRVGGIEVDDGLSFPECSTEVATGPSCRRDLAALSAGAAKRSVISGPYDHEGDRRARDARNPDDRLSRANGELRRAYRDLGPHQERRINHVEMIQKTEGRRERGPQVIGRGQSEGDELVLPETVRSRAAFWPRQEAAVGI